jgi:hypothetical protein
MNTETTNSSILIQVLIYYFALFFSHVGKPFHWVNQAHYDALGDTIYRYVCSSLCDCVLTSRHIQELMVSQFGLQEVLLPLNNNGTGPFNNIFVSPDWKTAKKLMLIIQGSGAVRYGLN